jgi:hypothetical protein
VKEVVEFQLSKIKASEHYEGLLGNQGSRSYEFINLFFQVKCRLSVEAKGVEAKRRLREEEDKGRPRGGKGQGEAKGRPRDSRGRRCRPRGGKGRVKEHVVIPFCISMLCQKIATHLS